MATYSRQFCGSHRAAKSTARRPHPSSTISHWATMEFSPQLSTPQLSTPQLSCGSFQCGSFQRGKVALGVAPMLPFFVHDDEQALPQRKVLDLRPPWCGLRHVHVQLLIGERLDHTADHRLALASDRQHLVERRARLAIPRNAFP